MSEPLFLDHRKIISVSGADREAFLNGLLTVSTTSIGPREIRYGALLTPQGKVIADMMLGASEDAILIDCDSAAAPGLLKRLNLFRLRANVAITERADLAAIAFDGAPDPRAAAAPRRSIGPRASARPADPAQYHAARILSGLPEQGADFGAEEVFPADINMDLIDGVDFRKGCFVGQEVVSRMKRRGNVRRRTLKASIAPGTPPCPVLANGFEIGVLSSVSGGAALARLRIDRLAEAQAKAEAITANGSPVTFDDPPWLGPELAALKEAKGA